MKEYYYYWERRVYNALVKMIMRALIAFKNLLMQPASKSIPLFQINAEFDPPKIISSHPSMLDVNQYLKRIQEGNIIERAKSFARWMDGHC